MEDARENRIEKKINAIAADINGINVTLAKQSIVLEEHQRRSLANELSVDILKKNHDMFSGALKLIALITAAAAAVQLFIK